MDIVNKRLDELSYEVETESGVLRRGDRVYLNRTNEIRRQHDSVNEREKITTEYPRDAKINGSIEQKECATHPNKKKRLYEEASEALVEITNIVHILPFANLTLM